ncbi:MAG: protease [bacterium]|nr:protease [bacterium]
MRAKALAFLVGLFLATSLAADSPAGYYRFPEIHGDVIVFTAEGDLWKVGVEGGIARRLTSHPGQETHAAISPDGKAVAFSADYEGPTEVYVMPLAGGLPERLTWEGRTARVVGWTPGGEVLYATRHFSTLPNDQLVRVDAESRERSPLPLAQASQGVFEPMGATLYFTRLPFQGSHTKRYKGGTAENLWRFTEGEAEAVPLTGDYAGTSREPMWWDGRVLFASDRDGTMNLWSMAPDGSDLKQHTRHVGWDVKSPSHSEGKVVYQLGADLHLFDLATGTGSELPVTLASDFDQRREKWVDEPMDYLTAAHLSPDGDRVALTARGQVFVAPVKQGRMVEAGRPDGVRFRSARFLPAAGDDSSDSLVVLSDESGEVELWRLDARGVETAEQLTEGATELRFDVFPSPDGRRVAYLEKDDQLWILDLESGRQTLVATSRYFGFNGFAWSPDGRWLAFAIPAENFLSRIDLYNVDDATTTALTSDRFDSHSPAWSPDGKWIYFLSDRNLVSLTRHPWGSYHPGPLLDRKTRIYQAALQTGLRSPFDAPDELTREDKDGEKTNGTEEQGEKTGKKGKEKKKETEGGEEKAEKKPRVEIVLEGLAERLHQVPVPPGNYTRLTLNDKALFWLSAETSIEQTQTLQALAIGHDEPKVKSVLADVRSYELSGDGKKLLLRKNDHLYVSDAKAGPLEDLGKHQVDLAGWTFPLDPREEWRQMFRDAWRLLRDYFYDPGMHGVDWPATLAKYLPLVDRVTDRAELSDVFAELTGELSALHHFVRGGDTREGTDQITPASLGAVLERTNTGGYRVAEIYPTDPDLPEERSPLARPGVDVSVGDVITAINGVALVDVEDPGELLRNQAGKQVLLQLNGSGPGEAREVIVEPITPRQATELRYDAWEHRQRLLVDELGQGEIGYVHLRNMGGAAYTEWARHYFPVFKRKGLIIDVRHNRGGNIDSWILGSLLRRPWMWWKPRAGSVYRNMQYSFGGHMVVLINERTASDGEAFAEGFRRLGLGKVLGARTWGGEIWLTASNVLVDRGIATAAEFGVYGPEGEWLIEGHGVEPDIVVDNPPHATFSGEDAQLAAAIEHLKQLIRDDPPEVPEPPPYPDKSLRASEGH